MDYMGEDLGMFPTERFVGFISLIGTGEKKILYVNEYAVPLISAYIDVRDMNKMTASLRICTNDLQLGCRGLTQALAFIKHALPAHSHSEDASCAGKKTTSQLTATVNSNISDYVTWKVIFSMLGLCLSLSL